MSWLIVVSVAMQTKNVSISLFILSSKCLGFSSDTNVFSLHSECHKGRLFPHGMTQKSLQLNLPSNCPLSPTTTPNNATVTVACINTDLLS
jgi:hypothetical protein